MLGACLAQISVAGGCQAVRVTVLSTRLASDIVVAIVSAEEPSVLALERLTKGVPMLWEEQRIREAFGIPA
jgi:hypothetical protein